MKYFMTVAAFCCGLFLPSLAQAVSVYHYTGANFDVFLDSTDIPGTYTNGNRVTGFIKIDDVGPGGVGKSYGKFSPDLIDFSFTDGRNTISKGDAGLDTVIFQFFFLDRAIIDWTVSLQINRLLLPNIPVGTPNFGIEIGGPTNTTKSTGFMRACPASSQPCLNTADLALDLGRTDTLGSWKVAPVPLPAAFPLLVGGLGALGLVGWRRKRTKI